MPNSASSLSSSYGHSTSHHKKCYSYFFLSVAPKFSSRFPTFTRCIFLTLNISGFCIGLEFAGFGGKLAMEPASLVAFRTSAAAASTDVNRSFAWQQATPKRKQPVMASKSGVKVVSAGCKTCRGKGAVECEGCKGTGRNKKNGNIFERWKCFDCQGFGMKGCPSCGKGGLTPEQRGER